MSDRPTGASESLPGGRLRFYPRALAASILGSAAGFLVGTTFFFLVMFRPWNGARDFAAMVDLKGVAPIYLVVIFAISLLGWLLYLLPLTFVFRARRQRRRKFIIIGALTGGLLVTIAYTLLFHGEPHAVRGSLFYELSGVLNAGTAAGICTNLLWRWTRLPQQPGQVRLSKES